MFRVSCIQLKSNNNINHNLKKTEKLIIKAVKQIDKIETATEQKFQDYFINAMKFPTAPLAIKSNKRNRRRKTQ